MSVSALFSLLLLCSRRGCRRAGRLASIQWLPSAQSDCRERQSIPNQMNDIRFAFRKLRQSPAFTSIAIITLALGIGLNTAIFSLINDLFLRGLPFKEPSRVVHLDNSDKTRDLADVGIGA